MAQRSYHDFLHADSRTASPSPSSPRLRFSITPSPSNPSNMSRASPLPPRRLVGDGFDYRRPVISTGRSQQATRTRTPTPDVIDLTNDSDTSRRTSPVRTIPRSQISTRRHHDAPGQRRQELRSAVDMQVRRPPVIDLEMLEFGNLAPPPDPGAPLMMDNEDFLALFQEPPSSPGFEITGERTVRPDPPRRSVAERRPTPYVTEEERDPSEAPQLPPLLFRGLPHGLASWIVQAGSRIAGGNIAGRAERNPPPEGLTTNGYPYSNGLYTRLPQFNTGNGGPPQSQVQLPRLPALDNFQRPRMNYEAQGFELLGAVHSSPPPRPSSPYKAPRAAGPGFARKVEEDDIVVCPHCGDELGMGADDLKQQIWVVKQCGHVSNLCSIFCDVILTVHRSIVASVL